jgi:hypothetical protein
VGIATHAIIQKVHDRDLKGLKVRRTDVRCWVGGENATLSSEAVMRNPGDICE